MAIGKRVAPAPSARAAAPARGASGAVGRAPASEQAVMSLNPEDFTQGGLLDDIDVLFAECRWVEWDYNGAIDHPTLALKVNFEFDDNGKQETSEQYYSGGELNRFQPSADGRQAIAVAGARGMNNNTNAAMLIKSIIEQGFPVDKFGNGDVGSLDGLQAHINRVPQPKRGGNISDKNNAGYEKTVAVVTKIHRMPWETGNAKAGTAGARTAAAKPSTAAPRASTGAPAASNGDAGDLNEEAAGVLLEVLTNKGGSVKKSQLAPASFKPLTGNPNRSEILKLMADENWLIEQGENFGWAYDNQTITASA